MATETRKEQLDEAKKRAAETRALPEDPSHKRTNGGAIFKDDPTKGKPEAKEQK
jgi:hypothetical protein